MGKKKKSLSNEEMFVSAASHGLTAKIDELIDKVDINCQDEFGNTALHYVTRNNNYFLTVFFLERDANINTLNHEGHTPLFAAVRYLVLEGMLFSEEARLAYTLLVSHGANVEELSSLYSLYADELDEFQLSTLGEIIETLNGVTFTAEEAIDYVMDYINGNNEDLEDEGNHTSDNTTISTEAIQQQPQNTLIQPINQLGEHHYTEELSTQQSSSIQPFQETIENTGENVFSTLITAGLILSGACNAHHN